MTETAARRRAWRCGLLAETLCVVWLRILGYRVPAQRLRTPVGEIDILARCGDVLAVIEVKARRTRAAALESITAWQRGDCSAPCNGSLPADRTWRHCGSDSM